MRRVRLIHWHPAEAAERAARIEAAGYAVDHHPFAGPVGLRDLRERPPAAVVIDLGRLPMQGRDVGIAIRHAGATRHLPLVFVGGDPEKVRRIRRQLPDAVYAAWAGIGAALTRALAHPPVSPVAPRSVFDVYAGVPLAKKLGIRADAVVALVDAPRGFRQTLGTLPPGARLQRRTTERPDLTVWFVRSHAILQRRLPAMVARAERGGLWIAWPKQSSGVSTDVSQVVVRQAGLAAGLVDFKIAALDARWSGLRFTRKRPGEGRKP